MISFQKSLPIEFLSVGGIHCIDCCLCCCCSVVDVLFEFVGNIMVPTSHGERVGIHLLPQSVIQQNMHFTNLLNSDLASIGEAVVRNQSLPVMSSIFKSFHGQSMQ